MGGSERMSLGLIAQMNETSAVAFRIAAHRTPASAISKRGYIDPHEGGLLIVAVLIFFLYHRSRSTKCLTCLWTRQCIGLCSVSTTTAFDEIHHFDAVNTALDPARFPEHYAMSA